MTNYLPATHRDASAEFELKLCCKLREINPAFQTARIDFTPFKPLQAKIDCITICQAGGISHDEIKVLQSVMKGTLARPNNRPSEVTIHDPSARDLRYLFDHYPSAWVCYMKTKGHPLCFVVLSK